uniref:Bm652, isoform b n=1 Tax=Brugia malayi TaxID=6279 RepID=A0A1I9G4F9_BRUMA|nr:Bm652, isoform b [Brugia malayi]
MISSTMIDVFPTPAFSLVSSHTQFLSFPTSLLFPMMPVPLNK